MRYADDFVIMADYIGRRIAAWVERHGGGMAWPDDQSDEDPDRDAPSPTGKRSLDFLGYTFRYDWDRHGRAKRYFTAEPSTKAMTRHQDALRS